MSTEVRFSPRRFAEGHILGPNSQKIAAKHQTVWQQIDAETWLEVEIAAMAEGYKPAPFVRSATLRRGHKPNGSWEQQHVYEPHRVRLVEDEQAPTAQAPTPPAPVENAGTAFIQKTQYALPEPRENWAEKRHKLGMH